MPRLRDADSRPVDLRARRWLGPSCLAPIAGLLPGVLPAAALACALPPSIILTLPTGHYILAAALVVAGTALLALSGRRLPDFASVTLFARPAAVGAVGSWCGLVLLMALIAIGFWGDRDPMHNLMTLVFWAGVWVALPLASMLLGDLWRPIAPWRGPVRWMRRALGRTGGIGLMRMGHWPAVLGFAAFSWFQIVSLYPDDPAVLAALALTYWAVIFGLAVAEGEDWLDQGEFLTVLFAMLARIAPLWRLRQGPLCLWRAGWPGAQILALPPLDLSGRVFITLVLAALTFDGLSETFFWHGLIGENPLEPIGRSAVMLANTAGLVGVWGLTVVAVFGAIRLGRLPPGPVALGFLVIAAGYHAAHYLVMLLTAGQYLIEALNDPLHRGASLLGLPHHFVSMGFLTDPKVMPLIYGSQFMAILLAHLLALVVSLKAAPGGQVGRLRGHLPLALLMVGYTVLGLWLLSTARAG